VVEEALLDFDVVGIDNDFYDFYISSTARRLDRA
jgi:hypothetical protein